MTDDSCPRESTLDLLARLGHACHSDSDAEAPAFRHLGIAALNLATETTAESLITAGRMLPWLAVYLRWDEGATVEELVDMICDHRLVANLGRQSLRRRLSAGARTASTAIRRFPNGAQRPVVDRRRAILAAIVEHDESLATLLTLTGQEAADEILKNSGLLAAIIEQCAETKKSEAAGDLEKILPPWSVRRPAPALEILNTLEISSLRPEAIEDVAPALGLLKERERDFEKSLIQHLESHALLHVVRAALAFAPEPGADALSQREISRFLAGFTVFADDPALRDLAAALITARHLVVGHISGALPMEALHPWVDYLRGSCAEFAESRGITLREATNFAHYSFHLVNLCDLAAREDVELRAPLRRAQMDVEDELKEFALVGQRQGLTDRQSDLGRYENSRWRLQGPRALLADRLARLGGAWRRGHRPGPTGSPPRLDDDLFDRCTELVGNAEDSTLDAMANLLRHAVLCDAQWLAAWPPTHILSLLSTALMAARDSELIDTDAPFIVDLSPLRSWLDRGCARERATIICALLERITPEHVHISTDEEHRIGLNAQASQGRLTLDFVSNSELEALLTLLASSLGDEAMCSMLTERLESLCPRPSIRREVKTVPVRFESPTHSSDKKTTEKELSG